MKSIIVTTDFSPQSEYTLRHVLDLLKDTEVPTRVILLNTYLFDFNNEPQQLIELNDTLKSESKKNLEEIKIEAMAWVRNPNISIELSSHMGSLHNVITNLIRKEKIDYVAMGKHGGQQIEQIAEILKAYKCPLLITDESKHGG